MEFPKTSAVPSLDAMDPDCAYLAWTVALPGHVADLAEEFDPRRIQQRRDRVAEVIAVGAVDLVLDTHHTLEAAGGLYARSGFEPIAPYNDNPNATRWYGKRLD